jgi:hypothetical protein
MYRPNSRDVRIHSCLNLKYKAQEQNSHFPRLSVPLLFYSRQTRPVFIKRLVIADTVKERILKARRSLAADRPHAGSAHIDGASLLAKEEREQQNLERRRRDEEDISARRIEKLATLEMLFGWSLEVTKA